MDDAHFVPILQSPGVTFLVEERSKDAVSTLQVLQLSQGRTNQRVGVKRPKRISHTVSFNAFLRRSATGHPDPEHPLAAPHCAVHWDMCWYCHI